MEIEAVRSRVLRGEDVSLEELRSLLQSVRRGYRAASAPKERKAPSRSSAAKAKSPSLTLDDINKLFD